MKNLNKNIIITGSEGQIGQDLLKKIADANYSTILLDKKKKIKKNYFCVDFNNDKDTNKTLLKIKKKYKNIFAVVNLAAYQTFTDFEKRSISEINQSYNVNIKSNILLTQFIYKNFFKHQKFGKIINISSIFGMYSPDFKNYKTNDRKSSEIYGATKAGVIQLTKYFANYMSKSNVNVNCISPGGVKNSYTQTKKFIKRYSKNIPSKRMGKAEEISNLIIFLLSEDNNYVNGENIVIDGGYSSKL